jgi:hypothetical protein
LLKHVGAIVKTNKKLVSYPINAEVAQKGKKLLPENGIVLPKHVGAIVKENKEEYNFSAFSWLIST